jgi:diguanylate cyclase (GGDEF)-like protein
VNGRKVTDAVLTTNDRIALGRTVLRFEEQDELAQAYDEQMERLLSLDDLSGLLLRRRFDREFSLLLDGIKRGRSALSLLVMDLDGIKKINDTHGHAFGAFVIGQAGRRIGAVVGDRGIASRFGGDEFCAALPDMDGEGAFALATEVLDAIGAAPFVREGIELRPGISIGVATFPADADDAAGLFQRADEAMYRAKSGGKHRVSR